MIKESISSGAAVTDPFFVSFNNSATSHWGRSAFTKPGLSATLNFGTQVPDLLIDINSSTIFGNTTTTQDAFGITFVLDFSQTQHEANSAYKTADELTGFTIFGQKNVAAAVYSGTSVTKFQPFIGTDTLEEPISVNCKYNNITAMKEYDGKSLDELRMEDYLANRKGPQDGAAVGFVPPVLFGQPTAEATKDKEFVFGQPDKDKEFVFGQPESKNIKATASQTFKARPFSSTKSLPFKVPFTFRAKSAIGPSLKGQPATVEKAPAFDFGQVPADNTGFNDFGTAASTTCAEPTFATFSFMFQCLQCHNYKMQIDFPLATKPGPPSSWKENNKTSLHLVSKPTISPALTFGSGLRQTAALFEGANTSTVFGNTTTQPAFGIFSQAQQNNSIFGATQPQANSSSLFGQTGATSAFGAVIKPTGLGTFGQPEAQPYLSLFGQSTASTSTSGFGTFGQTAPTTGFGSATTLAFGQPENEANAENSGTSVKYEPIFGTDVITTNNGRRHQNINTKFHCITAMKEYEVKSLEELRMEYYLTNQKVSQAGASGGFGGFVAKTQAKSSTNEPFTGLFYQQAAEATANQATSSKPFGETNVSSFGQTSATHTASAFGQTASGFGSGFGVTASKQQLSFGKPVMIEKKTAFNTGFGAEPSIGTFLCTFRCNDYNIQIGFVLPATNSASN